MNLADRLKFAMKRAGLDDRALAKEVSRLSGRQVPWQTIQSIRTGRSKSTKYGAHIAAATDVDPHWFLTGDEPSRLVDFASHGGGDVRISANRTGETPTQYSARSGGDVVHVDVDFRRVERQLKRLEPRTLIHVLALIDQLAEKTPQGGKDGHDDLQELPATDK